MDYLRTGFALCPSEWLKRKHSVRVIRRKSVLHWCALEAKKKRTAEEFTGSPFSYSPVLAGYRALCGTAFHLSQTNVTPCISAVYHLFLDLHFTTACPEMASAVPNDLRSPRRKVLLRRGMSGIPCLACCHRKMTPDKWKIMDAWMDGCAKHTIMKVAHWYIRNVISKKLLWKSIHLQCPLCVWRLKVPDLATSTWTYCFYMMTPLCNYWKPMGKW